MASAEACFSGSHAPQRSRAYITAPATTSAVSSGASKNMMTSVTRTSAPSSTASTTSTVSARRMVSWDAKRETMSPRWRDSNDAGRFTRWLKRLEGPWTFRVAPSAMSIQLRMAVTAMRRSIRSPKPSARTSSRSRSAATSAWSTTHWRNSGLNTASTSMAAAIRNSCASVPRRPMTRPSSAFSFTRGGGSAASNPSHGKSSSATPVKCRDTTESGSRRTPTAGSCITTPSAPALLSTTK